MKAIEYKIVLTWTSIQINDEGGTLVGMLTPITATVTVSEDAHGEMLSPHEILDRLFNQIYGKMTEVEA